MLHVLKHVACQKMAVNANFISHEKRKSSQQLVTRSNWNLDYLFWGREEPGKPREQPLEQDNNIQQANNPHIMPSPQFKPRSLQWKTKAFTSSTTGFQIYF